MDPLIFSVVFSHTQKYTQPIITISDLAPTRTPIIMRLMKLICKISVIVLLTALTLSVLGSVIFIGCGALLAQWLSLSLFQASGLMIGSALTLALIIRVFVSIFHFHADHLLRDDVDDWDPDDWDVDDTDRVTPKSDISKVGRNEPCLCGSGKKYKICCGT